jgi:MYXO-CTERM domain-containing protein
LCDPGVTRRGFCKEEIDLMKRQSVWVAALVGIAGLTAMAQGGLQGAPVRFEVTAADGQRGAWQLDQSVAPWINGRWNWNSSAPIQIRSSTSGDVLATISTLSVGYIEDPVITLNYTVTASSVTTSFNITSGLLTFAPFVGEARATMSSGISDSDGNGASVAGAHSGSLYRANLNGTMPGGTQFTTLGPSMSASGFGSNSFSGSTPGVGFTPVGLISSMQASFAFDLSAFDQAAGTSTFVTQVPTPGALAVLGLAGLAAGRRRR